MRCHKCNKSLALPNLVRGSASALPFLSQQKPKMLACPNCRQPLPRCALCLLPMGCINPYLQFYHMMQQKKRLQQQRRRATSSRNSAAKANKAGGVGAGAGAGASSSAAGSGDGGADPDVRGVRAPRQPFVCSRGVMRVCGQGYSTPSFRNALPFADWWTWCHTCRHGGHASHLAEWFSKQDMCPVSDCQCRCNSLDAHPKARTPEELLDVVSAPPRGAISASPGPAATATPTAAPAAAATAAATAASLAQVAGATKARGTAGVALPMPVYATAEAPAPPPRRVRTGSITRPSRVGSPVGAAGAPSLPRRAPAFDPRVSREYKAYGFM